MFHENQRVALNTEGASFLRRKWQWLTPSPAAGMVGTVVALVGTGAPRVKFDDFAPCPVDENGGYWMAYDEVVAVSEGVTP